METIEEIERRLERLEAAALLHGRTDEIERQIANLVAGLDEVEEGAGEDWLMERDRELRRALRPVGQ